MKTLLMLAVMCLLTGCKGKDGEDGAPGTSFTSSMVNLNGAVTSDSIAITVPGLSLSRGDILNVYTCIGTACVQLNAYQSAVPNNMVYIAQGTTVTILNAQTGSQTLWYISALLKN